MKKYLIVIIFSFHSFRYIFDNKKAVELGKKLVK